MAVPALGVIGVGALGSRHAAVLARLAARPESACRFAGVYDLVPERSREAAARHGTTAFATADALYGACDGVAVAVPTVAHRAVAERGLAAGCDLLIEKPLADGLVAADEILEHAQRLGRGVFVGHSERFNPAVRAAAGYWGRPRYLESQRLSGFAPRGVDVDVVLDLMIHDIDLVLAIVGETPSAISAIGVAVLTDREDLANARLEFPSGAVANLTASRVSPERVRKLRAFSAHAYLSIDSLEGTAEAVFADPARLAQAARAHALHAARAAGTLVEEAPPLPDWTALVERRELEVPPGEPLELELEAFARAVARGASTATASDDGRSFASSPEPTSLGLATGAEGRAALAVAEAVQGAIRERFRRWRA